jgi:hypothetical protein
MKESFIRQIRFGELGLELDLVVGTRVMGFHYDHDWVSDHIGTKDRDGFLSDNHQHFHNAALAAARNALPADEAEQLPYVGTILVPFDKIQVSKRHGH